MSLPNHTMEGSVQTSSTAPGAPQLVASGHVDSVGAGEIATPAQADARHLAERHRVAFNAEVLGRKDRPGKDCEHSNRPSKVWSQAEYERRLMVCDPSNWGIGNLGDMEDGERERCGAFRNKFPEGNNWKRFFAVIEAASPGGATGKRLVRIERDKASGEMRPGRLVLPPLEIFRAIDDAHTSLGHKKVRATMDRVAAQYWNVTRDHVAEYIKLCPACNRRTPGVPKRKEDEARSASPATAAISLQREWFHLKTGKEFSRILYPNPVCLLSTINSTSALASSNEALLNDGGDSTVTVEHNVKRNVMVLSWLTATNNEGRFMFSIHKSRHSTSLLCRNSGADTSPFRTGTEFTLSVPVQGMEQLVLDVGSMSGRRWSKFENNEYGAASERSGIDAAQHMSKRQRKKQRQERLSLHGVAGLVPVSLGSSHSRHTSTLSPSSLFAIKGTVAHLKCRTYGVIGTPAAPLTGSKREHPSGPAEMEAGAVDGTAPPVIDPQHLLVLAEVTEAYVHPAYWDHEKLLFRPLSAENIPPYLTFLGSQTFGYITSLHNKNKF